MTWPTFLEFQNFKSLELLTVKHVHIICYMLSFPSMFIRWWFCTCEELEWIKKAKKWGVFYRCEEYAWMLYEFWGRTYFSHICEILVWNPWHIGTNSSRAVKNWYQLFTVWNLRSVKFTVQQCYMNFENVRISHTFVRYWYEIRDKLVTILHARWRIGTIYSRCEIYEEWNLRFNTAHYVATQWQICGTVL